MADASYVDWDAWKTMLPTSSEKRRKLLKNLNLSFHVRAFFINWFTGRENDWRIQVSSLVKSDPTAWAPYGYGTWNKPMHFSQIADNMSVMRAFVELLHLAHYDQPIFKVLQALALGDTPVPPLNEEELMKHLGALGIVEVVDTERVKKTAVRKDSPPEARVGAGACAGGACGDVGDTDEVTGVIRSTYDVLFPSSHMRRLFVQWFRGDTYPERLSDNVLGHPDAWRVRFGFGTLPSALHFQDIFNDERRGRVFLRDIISFLRLNAEFDRANAWVLQAGSQGGVGKTPPDRHALDDEVVLCRMKTMHMLARTPGDDGAMRRVREDGTADRGYEGFYPKVFGRDVRLSPDLYSQVSRVSMPSRERDASAAALPKQTTAPATVAKAAEPTEAERLAARLTWRRVSSPKASEPPGERRMSPPALVAAEPTQAGRLTWHRVSPQAAEPVIERRVSPQAAEPVRHRRLTPLAAEPVSERRVSLPQAAEPVRERRVSPKPKAAAEPTEAEKQAARLTWRRISYPEAIEAARERRVSPKAAEPVRERRVSPQAAAAAASPSASSSRQWFSQPTKRRKHDDEENEEDEAAASLLMLWR
jgi:hypothetical protein